MPVGAKAAAGAGGACGHLQVRSGVSAVFECASIRPVASPGRVVSFLLVLISLLATQFCTAPVSGDQDAGEGRETSTQQKKHLVVQ